MQSANIFSNDPQNPKTKISITGFVKQYISIEPSIQIILQGYAGDKITKKVTVTSHEEQPLEITEISSTLKNQIQYELTTIEKGKAYGLEVKTLSGIKEPFQGKVILKTSSQKKPVIELAVISRLLKEVRMAPQYLYFGIINTSDTIEPMSLQRKVTVSSVRGSGLTIEKVEPSADWISTEIETDKKGENYTIVITLDKDKLPKGKLRENITVTAKYNKTSETVNIIIEARVD